VVRETDQLAAEAGADFVSGDLAKALLQLLQSFFKSMNDIALKCREATWEAYRKLPPAKQERWKVE